MIRVLEPLARIPGVRMALLVAPDGVPVVVKGQAAQEETRGDDPEGLPGVLAGESADSLAALATGWLGELTRAVAPLSWQAPQRVVLRAARGTLVMSHAPGAFLVVILDRGASPGELRLPMEAAIARMQRMLRGYYGADRPASQSARSKAPARSQEKGGEGADANPGERPRGSSDVRTNGAPGEHGHEQALEPSASPGFEPDGALPSRTGAMTAEEPASLPEAKPRSPLAKAMPASEVTRKGTGAAVKGHGHTRADSSDRHSPREYPT